MSVYSRRMPRHCLYRAWGHEIASGDGEGLGELLLLPLSYVKSGLPCFMREEDEDVPPAPGLSGDCMHVITCSRTFDSDFAGN